MNSRPCHVREDIIIPNVDSSRVSGHACIVRIDDGALATLLGDSEGPAHTEWQASSRNFKDKYIYGGKAIEFVSNFPYRASPPRPRDLKGVGSNVASRRVSRQRPGAQRQFARNRNRNQDHDLPPDIPKPDPSPARFRIAEIAAGFTISSVEGRLPVGVILKSGRHTKRRKAILSLCITRTTSDLPIKGLNSWPKAVALSWSRRTRFG